MQPVNEALMTDEEFLDHIEKVIKPQLRNCGSVELRAATVDRLCGMIRGRDKAMHLQIQTAKSKFTQMLDTSGNNKSSNVKGYLDLRKRVGRNADGTHDVTLSIVNIPCGVEGKEWTMGDPKTKIFLETTREDLIRHLDKIVERGIVGETDQGLVRQRVRDAGAIGTEALEVYGTIDPSKAAGKLLSYDVSGIRDGSGAFVITGKVMLTDVAKAMIESGNYIFGIRSIVTYDAPKKIIDKIHAFDMFPVHELNTAI